MAVVAVSLKMCDIFEGDAVASDFDGDVASETRDGDASRARARRRPPP